RVQDGGMIRCQLESVTITARDQGRALAAFLGGHSGGQKIVGLEACGAGICKAACLDQLRNHGKLLDELRIERAPALIVREQAVAKGRRIERVPADEDGARPLRLE